MNKELIKRPNHYSGKSGRDVIEFEEDMGLTSNHYRCSAIEYLVRADKKGTKRRDLEKAREWIAREIEAMEEQDNPQSQPAPAAEPDEADGWEITIENDQVSILKPATDEWILRRFNAIDYALLAPGYTRDTAEAKLNRIVAAIQARNKKSALAELRKITDESPNFGKHLDRDVAAEPAPAVTGEFCGWIYEDLGIAGEAISHPATGTKYWRKHDLIEDGLGGRWAIDSLNGLTLLAIFRAIKAAILAQPGKPPADSVVLTVEEIREALENAKREKAYPVNSYAGGSNAYYALRDFLETAISRANP